MGVAFAFSSLFLFALVCRIERILAQSRLQVSSTIYIRLFMGVDCRHRPETEAYFLSHEEGKECMMGNLKGLRKEEAAHTRCIVVQAQP